MRAQTKAKAAISRNRIGSLNSKRDRLKTRVSRLCWLLVAATLSSQSCAFAEPANSQNAGSALIGARNYDPDYTGDDFTRPETNIEARFENKRSGTTTRTDENTLTLRADGAYQLGPTWKMGWVAELPLLHQSNLAMDPAADSSVLAGAGDIVLQTTFVRDLSERWSVGFGARLVTPTGESSLGGGKWVIMPGFGFRYSFLEAGPNTYFVPKVRYAVSVAGDPTRRNISEPQFAPTLNIGLPDRWFLTLYPSYDIRINYGDPSSGQTGRLFLPFNAAIGRKLTDSVVVSLEVGTALISNYPVYKHKVEFRITNEF
jgi:hypothetical protein